MRIIKPLPKKITKNLDYGGKINGLIKLNSKGFKIPLTFVISPYNSKFVNTEDFHKELKNILNKFPNESKLAIRSSAIGEDGDKKSFAGIFETVLNVDTKNINNVINAINIVIASLTQNRVSAYKSASKNTKMGIIIQQMVQPKISGVAFTDSLTENGKNAIFIEYVKGLADKLVSGRVNSKKTYFIPNSNMKIPKSLNGLFDNLFLIRKKFKKPMDIEWAIDKNNKLWLLQARPITKNVFIPPKKNSLDAGIVASYGTGKITAQTYFINPDLDKKELEKVIKNMPKGNILVLTYSDTSFLPAMKKASAIISTTGSILSHAAIVSRELGIPCIIGIKDAEIKFPTGTNISIDPSTGDILSEKYNIRSNKDDIEWGEIDVYNYLTDINIDGQTVLFEKLNNNKIAVHLPKDASSKLIDSVEEYSRIKFNKSPKIYKSDKYLWYFENKRFTKIPLFNEFISEGQNIVDQLNIKNLKTYFNKLKIKCEELAHTRDITNNNYDKFMMEETIQAIHFAAAIRIAQGYAVENIYKQSVNILKKYKINFIDFMSLNGNEKILKDHKLSKLFIFIKTIEDERNKICTKLIKSGAMRYDYFDDREKRAKKALVTPRKNPINEFYDKL